ncbi:hypothetical protein AYI69_g1221 [Smittium culicis]|uniref:Uncharacterized protein n=1 Tax=Smittium culicis TaxID=133412 RepID=A0A1R1YQW0_9FUNG|nr:hypothetical protein AYI69_g1221 [Smittium culicis]
MNYNPPQLNDSELSVANMAYKALYGIQIALAQATKLIDYIVHGRILENSGIDNSDDPEVINSGKIGQVPFGLELPGKPTQLVEPDTKPLIYHQVLNTLIAKKTAAKRQRVQHFRKRQQSSIVRIRTAKLLRRRSPVLQLLLKQVQTTKNSTASQIFAGEVEAAERGLNRDTGKPPSYRTPRYLQIDIVQTDGQPMGSEHMAIQYENSVEGRIFAREKFDSGAVSVSKGARKAPFETCGTWSGPFGP